MNQVRVNVLTMKNGGFNGNKIVLEGDLDQTLEGLKIGLQAISLATTAGGCCILENYNSFIGSQ